MVAFRAIAIATVATLCVTTVAQQCRLCDTSDRSLSVAYNQIQTVSFAPCCDQLAGSQDCAADFDEKARYVYLDAPLKPSIPFNDLCFNIESMAVDESEESTCCGRRCECLGSTCRSFNGTEVEIIPCDARVVIDDCIDGVCIYSEELCLNSKDTDGNQCIWDPPVDERECPYGYDPDGLLTFGPPCKAPEPLEVRIFEVDGEPHYIPGAGRRRLQCDNLYSLDIQKTGQQISNIKVVINCQVINISPSHCFNPSKLDCKKVGEDRILVVDGQVYGRADGVECDLDTSSLPSQDWTITDQISGVTTNFLCLSQTTSTSSGKKRRLDVVSNPIGDDLYETMTLELKGVEEPDLDKLAEEFDQIELAGFCIDEQVNPNLTVRSPGNQCNSLPGQPVTSTLVARAICQDPSIRQASFPAVSSEEEDECFRNKFCATYGYPFYETVDDCFECFLRYKDLSYCFCNSMVSALQSKEAQQADVEECRAIIEEKGWNEAADIYIESYVHELSRAGVACPTFDELPTSLATCEEGVVMQVFSTETQEWSDYRAIPVAVTDCDGLQVCLKTEEEQDAFFDDRLRFKQSSRKGCYDCQPHLGVNVSFSVDFNAPSPKPTSQPTGTPSATPTGSPIDAPRNPELQCRTLATAPADPVELPTSLAERTTQGNDPVWLIHDQRTGIQAKIRCTANYIGRSRYEERLGLEDVIDPTPDSRVLPQGFCSDSVIERGGSNENTDYLDATGICNSVPEDTFIAKAICQDYIQAGAGVDLCRQSFCSTHWFPRYPSADDCVVALEKDWLKGFCGAFYKSGTPEYEECIDNINDFDDREEVEKVIQDATVGCSSDPDDFGDVMTECQSGAVLEYMGGKDEWITYKVFPSGSVCPEGVKFNAKDDAVLFTNRVRIRQTSMPRDKCIQVSTCTVTQEVVTELVYNRASQCDDIPFEVVPLTDDGIGQTVCNDVNGDLNTCQIVPWMTTGVQVEQVLKTMPQCCAPKDTSSVDPNVVLNKDMKYSRYSSACNPICTTCCDELTEEDTLIVKVDFAGSPRDGTCCASCTCYGDPRCISFDGTKKSWIPCDSRDNSTALGSSCAYTRAMCDTLTDPASEACVWTAGDDVISRRGNSILTVGPPCEPNPDTVSCMVMYRVLEQPDNHLVKFQLVNGVRGVITKLIMSIGLDDYVLDASECLDNESPWRLIPQSP